MNPLIANDIMNMTPGRELDALVAEKVMGWKERVDFDCIVEDTDVLIRYEPFSMEVREFHPSTDISAAWEVVEKIVSKGFSIQLDFEGDDYAFWINSGTRKLYEYGKTAPEAICRAALLAVMNP